MNQNLKAWVVCLLAALYFSYELVQLHMLNAISPYLLKDLRLSATDFGTLCSTYLMADVCFLVPAGMILDRFSTRRVILAALFFCIVGTVGFAFADTLATASLCHFLSGIGNAFCFLSCMMLVARWFPKEKQAFVVGLVITIGLSGGVIAQTPFSYLAQTLHWRNALLVDGAIGLLIFMGIYAFVYDRPAPIKGNVIPMPVPFFSSLKRALGNRQNILCGLYTGLMNLPLMIIGAMWGSLFLTQVHHLTLSRASFVSGMICLGTIVGSPLAGRLADLWGEKTGLMKAGALLSIGSMLLLLYLPSPSELTLILLFFALGFFTSPQVLGYPLVTESNPPELTGTAMGVAGVIVMGLAAVLQPLSGWLMEFYWDEKMADQVPLYSLSNYQFCFWMFPIGFALSLGLAYMIREKKPLLAKI
jgi:MFS family permease